MSSQIEPITIDPASATIDPAPADTVAAARRQLEAQRDELLASIADRQHDADNGGATATTGHGETEHLVVAEQTEQQVRLDALNRTALAEVKSALERIEQGTYGACTSCGADIPAERLEVLPATAVCVDCRARHEGS